MAAMFSVHDAMVLCGIDDVAQWHGNTQAERVAADVFSDSFQAVAKKTIKGLVTEFKDYQALTVANGKIALDPGIKNRIKAFIQWVRDEYRLGRDPSNSAYPVGDVARLLDRMKMHDDYIAESAQLAPDARPQPLSNDGTWEDFDRQFLGYLRLMPGGNGVPLVYVVRVNPIPDATPRPNYLDEYIHAAPLAGAIYIADNQKVWILFHALLTHEQALAVVHTLNSTSDGRGAYWAVKEFFEGTGIQQTKVVLAEKVIADLKYKGEKQPYMWWTRFEQELMKAYATIDSVAGRVVFDDAQRLRSLQGKIQCEWLNSHKSSIDTEIAKIPMTMTFGTAMTIYRNAVNIKFPPTIIPAPRARRGVAEVGRGRGYGGRGQHGGRGRGGRGRGDRRGRARNHPDQETIVLRNGQHIKYHPSYMFTREEMQQMTEGQRDRLSRERAAHRERQGLPPRQTRQQQQQQIQTLITEVASLRSQQEEASLPPTDITTGDAQTRISQVTTGTAGGNVMGGRNEQARRRAAGVRRIASTDRHVDFQEPVGGVRGDNELDSNADTCCLGQNFVILQHTQRIAEVFAYDDSLPSTTVPIVSGATAWTCPNTNVTYLLVVNEGLYYGTKLDHSLINPNQVRMYNNPLWDNPFDPMHSIGIELRNLFIPFRTKGTKVLFTTRAPTTDELHNCVKIHLTSKKEWDPRKVRLSQVHAEAQESHGEQGIDEDPRSNEYELRSLDPLMDPGSWRQVQQVQHDPRSTDVPTPTTFESTERHPRATPEMLSERWGISTQRARATMRATLQRGTRSAILPLARRYRADRMFDRPRLNGKFSTDTAYFKHKSLRGYIASQVYFHKCGFYFTHHITTPNDEQVGPSLLRFISDYGIPEKLVMDGAAVQVGRNTTIMETIRRAAIDYHISGPYRPEENPAEGGIRELKRRFYRLINKFNIPMRLWCFVLDYVVAIMNLTVNYSKYSNGRVPLEIITGITPDITEYLDFTIYCWVYFRTDGGVGLNEIGRWLGVSHRVGPMMTYWILPKSGIPISTDTVQALTQAELQTDVVKEQMDVWKAGVKKRFDAKSSQVNWDKDPIPQHKLFSFEDEDEEFLRNYNMPINEGTLEGTQREGTNEGESADAPDSQNYVGMQVGLRRGEDGELQRATVRRRAIDAEGRPVGIGHSNPMVDTRRYEVEYDDGTVETLSANLLAENILEQVDEHGYKHRMMEEIGGHRRLADAVSKEDGWYRTENGTKRRRRTTKGWDLYVIWKDGSSNFVPLSEMKESFPIETAEYAKDRGLSEEPAFAWWSNLALKKRDRIIKKVKSKYWERTHKYGIKIPHSIQEALAIDKENGNTLWEDAIKMEMKNNRVAFEEYNDDIEKLVGYKRITGHMVFDVKLGENFRRKARYVADGHKTTAPASLRYSTVVSRDSVRILLMIAALNDLDVQSADIQNAFLTAPNLEKCYMIAGPEFIDEEGKVFIVKRALYGLKSAPQAFRSFLADNIQELGFFSSEADPDVWLRPAVKPDGEKYYEYLLCYVDDILCLSVRATEVMHTLQTRFKFKKDLIEVPENYLGARVKKKQIDGHWMWAVSSVDYINAAVENVEKALEKKPRWNLPTRKNALTPMSTSFEPELDGSPELNADDQNYYQELIGVLRWATELGRVDILLEISLLSQYQACPREGHMEQLLRIFAFLKYNKKMSLYMDWRLPNIDTSMTRSSKESFKVFYRDAKEELPPMMPEPRGRAVSTTAYVDASHAANKKTRRSHTGYVIFVNRSPVLWHSKKQNTVEASTFGAEFIAMKACIEAITHLRYKLRMFGIPLMDEPTRVLCDNESVVKNSAHVESTLNKKHNSIAYHYTRWNVAAGVVEVSWLNGIYNLADAFTKRLTQARREFLFGEWTY